jgi:hypothetical protein
MNGELYYFYSFSSVLNNDDRSLVEGSSLPSAFPTTKPTIPTSIPSKQPTTRPSQNYTYPEILTPTTNPLSLSSSSTNASRQTTPTPTLTSTRFGSITKVSPTVNPSFRSKGRKHHNRKRGRVAMNQLQQKVNNINAKTYNNNVKNYFVQI